MKIRILLTAFMCLLLVSPLALAQPRQGILVSKTLTHLTMIDTAPLDDRMPLILVHGIGPQQGEYYNWGTFLAYAQQQAEFQKRFKVYLFSYNPSDPVQKSGQELINTLHQFLQVYPTLSRFRVIAHSQGGLVFRVAYKDARVATATEKVLTIGTPFHGTPLANPAWFKKALRKQSPLSLMRLADGISYAVAGRRYPAFEQDYCWDNFDASMPVNSRIICSYEPCTPEQTASFVTYASFFGLTKSQKDYMVRQLDLTQPWPGENGVGLLSSHQMFAMVQKGIADVPLKDPIPKNLVSLMTYNDGVTPISSGLWLGRYYPPNLTNLENSQSQLWKALQALRDNPGSARLFAGVDHRNWMEGKTLTDSPQVSDLLHPQEPPRQLFDWLLLDLLQ